MGLDGGFLGKITDEIEHGVKDALEGAEKLVDKLPQDGQDVIHNAERDLKGKRDEISALVIDWLVERITPKSFNDIVRPIVIAVLRGLATKRFKEDAAEADKAEASSPQAVAK